MIQIHEIYRSILGESRDAGRPGVIVRLTGCHRRCSYCDTEYAFTGGRRMTVEQVCAVVDRYGFRAVLITGGEPLLQESALVLMERLLAAHHHVILRDRSDRRI